MPAKTVQDLIAFNASVSDEFKVGVKFTNHRGEFYVVGFCSLKTGEEIEFQTHELRNKYYEHTDDYFSWQVKYGLDPKTESGPDPRYSEPTHKKLMPWGFVSCKDNIDKANYNCHNAWFVRTAKVAQGYGPMLYDCLLVILGQSDNGLIGDRSLVSPTAASVWAEYLESRPDVMHKQLDFEPFQTPDTKDDCYASHEKNPKWNSWLRDSEKQKTETQEEFNIRKEKYQKMRKAMAYAYFDNGIKTLDELKEAKLFIGSINEHYHEKSTKKLKKLYESFIRDLRG